MYKLTISKDYCVVYEHYFTLLVTRPKLERALVNAKLQIPNFCNVAVPYTEDIIEDLIRFEGTCVTDCNGSVITLSIDEVLNVD